MRAEDVPRAEAAPRLDEQREGRAGGDVVREPCRRRRDPELLEEDVRKILVLRALDHVCVGQQQDGSELIAAACKDGVIEIGERDDEVDPVLAHELGERRDVGRIVDPRHERVLVGRVERRRQAVQVDRERVRPRASERLHDVDALPRAGEEDGAHRARGYPCRPAPSPSK